MFTAFVFLATEIEPTNTSLVMECNRHLHFLLCIEWFGVKWKSLAHFKYSI